VSTFGGEGMNLLFLAFFLNLFLQLLKPLLLLEGLLFLGPYFFLKFLRSEKKAV